VTESQTKDKQVQGVLIFSSSDYQLFSEDVTVVIIW